MSTTLKPSLWYSDKAEEAARFYAGIIPDSRVERVTTMPAESPSGPPGSVTVVEFTLAGVPFTAMSAGPLDPFNHAVSFTLECDTQEEIDRLWTELLDGGQPEQCGWLRDRYGLAWQIVPRRLAGMLADPDREAAGRAAEAMLAMIKLDLPALEAAFANHR